jgi:aspartate/methionine/tyrosine aminotransferase
MKIKPFRLERWLLEPAEIDLGGGGVTKLTLRDVLDEIPFDHQMKYGRTDGSDALKALISDWFNGIEHDRILVTSGTSEANLLVNYTLLEPGDHYLTENPQYEQTTRFVESLGVKTEEFQLNEPTWKPNLDELAEKVTAKTRIIFIDNPNNPTGALLTEKEMRTICEIAEDVGAYVHCDNALRGSELTGKPAETPLPYYEKAIVTGSISKLGATSPRIGWIIAEEEVIKECWNTKDYTTLGHSGLGEIIAQKILSTREELVKRNLAISRRNIETLKKWVNQHKAQVSMTQPEAGFTGFPKYSLDLPSEKLCREFLESKKTLLSPGAHFGKEGYLRINTGSKNESLVEGLNRLGEYLEEKTR